MKKHDPYKFEKPPVKDLFVYPTYSILLPQREKRLRPNNTMEKANAVKSLRVSKPTGLSKKSAKRLKNAVNWLIACSEKKHVYSKQSGKSFYFQLSFITLTLPVTEVEMNDKTIKNKLLHLFINQARNRWGMKSYVWKAETQENGNIHFHLTTDVYMDSDELRSVWNKCLNTHGILQKYTQKFSSMSFEDYCNATLSKKTVPHDVQLRRFQLGQATGFKSPNTTDIHAVYKVRDVGAYLATYLSKKEDGRRVIEGRVWGASQNLSEASKLVIECAGKEGMDILDSLGHDDISCKEIETVNKKTGSCFKAGRIYFYSLSHWGKTINGTLLKYYYEHIKQLRRFQRERATPTEYDDLFTKNLLYDHEETFFEN